jgi:hypothetical protein
MKGRWLIPMLAAAVCAVPARAEDKTPTTGAPATAVTTVEPLGASATAVKSLANASTSATTATAQAGDTKAPPKPPKWTYGGQADAYFSHNFNDPFVRNDFLFQPIGGVGANSLDPFAFKDDGGVHIGLLKAWVQRARTPVGGRLDLMWGDIAHVVNFPESLLSSDDVWNHIEQAFLSVNITKDGKNYLDVGRFVTPVGAEVIEPKDNWLYTRGILFGWAVPFTHTGARLYHYFNDTDYVMGMINQGWDVVSANRVPGTSNHTGPGFGFTGSKTLSSKWVVTASYLGGSEPNSNGSVSYRNLFDVVALYTHSPKWAFTFNGDLGIQGNDAWYGISAQAKYAFHPRQYAAARAEFMRDDSGFRFATGSDTTAYGVTLGYTYLWSKYFQTRVEYRHDFSGGNQIFVGDSRRDALSQQGRFIVSAIASY